MARQRKGDRAPVRIQRTQFDLWSQIAKAFRLDGATDVQDAINAVILHQPIPEAIRPKLVPADDEPCLPEQVAAVVASLPVLSMVVEELHTRARRSRGVLADVA